MFSFRFRQLLRISAPLLSAALSCSAQRLMDQEGGFAPVNLAALQRQLASGTAKFRSLHSEGASPHSEPQALPHWTGSFSVNGNSANRAGDRQTYSYTMVGTDPSRGSATTTIRTILVPLRAQFADGTVFDASSYPTQPLNTSAVNNLLNSPQFKPSPVYAGSTNLGNTQYADAIQRGSFWDIVSRKAPNYHVLLKPEVYATQTLVVPERAAPLNGFLG